MLQVNQYPGHRDFKAIGSGGDDFKQTIVRAVEDIVGPVNQDRVMERPSSQGKFISVTLRDVKVQNPDQVTLKYISTRQSQLNFVFGWNCFTMSQCLAPDCSVMGFLPVGPGCICSNEEGQKTEVLFVKAIALRLSGSQASLLTLCGSHVCTAWGYCDPYHRRPLAARVWKAEAFCRAMLVPGRSRSFIHSQCRHLQKADDCLMLEKLYSGKRVQVM